MSGPKGSSHKGLSLYQREPGNTRHGARHLAAASTGQLVEITDTADYAPLTRFLVRCTMARAEEKTTIEPASFDVSGYDPLIFGSPPWAFKPTPIVHAPVDTLKGCEGKRATVFCTRGGLPGQTPGRFQKRIEARGMLCVGNATVHQEETENGKKNQDLIALLIKEPCSGDVMCRPGDGDDLDWLRSGLTVGETADPARRIRSFHGLPLLGTRARIPPCHRLTGKPWFRGAFLFGESLFVRRHRYSIQV